jgi:hypothetical protein
MATFTDRPVESDKIESYLPENDPIGQKIDFSIYGQKTIVK